MSHFPYWASAPLAFPQLRRISLDQEGPGEEEEKKVKTKQKLARDTERTHLTTAELCILDRIHAVFHLWNIPSPFPDRWTWALALEVTLGSHTAASRSFLRL